MISTQQPLVSTQEKEQALAGGRLSVLCEFGHLLAEVTSLSLALPVCVNPLI